MRGAFKWALRGKEEPLEEEISRSGERNWRYLRSNMIQGKEQLGEKMAKGVTGPKEVGGWR